MATDLHVEKVDQTPCVTAEDISLWDADLDSQTVQDILALAPSLGDLNAARRILVGGGGDLDHISLTAVRIFEILEAAAARSAI